MLTLKQTLTSGLVAATALAMAPSFGATAQAADIEIEFTGLDLFFNDRGGSLQLRTEDGMGGVGQDMIDTINVYVDGTLVGSQMGGVARMAIPGFNGISENGGSDQNDYGLGYFAVDFTPTEYDNGEINMLVTASAATLFYEDQSVSFLLAGDGLLDDPTQQPLPFGIVLSTADSVTFTWSASNVSDLQTDNGIVTQFQGRGAGTLFQDGVVPEPASLSLLALGGLALVRRRR